MLFKGGQSCYDRREELAMKMIRFICIVLIAGLFTASVAADSQMDNLKSTYDQSTLKVLIESIPFEAFVYENQHYGDAQFYPIGISQNGRLAYLSYATNPQYIRWVFVIFDLVQDRILRRRSGEPHEEVASPLRFFQIDRLTKDLQQYGIYLSDAPLKPQKFPLHYDNDSYSVELKEKATADDDYSMDKPYTVHLNSSKKGSKRLSEITCSPYSDPTVEGYLLSPFEHRIVVIVRYDVAHIEADSAGSFTLTGGHLLVGFK